MNRDAKCRSNGRPPPSLTPAHNADAERSLIGELLLEPSNIADVAAILCPEDFYLLPQREMFRAILSVNSKGLEVCPVTVAEELVQTGKFANAGNGQALIDSMEAIPHGAHALTNAKIILEKSHRRQLSMRLTDLAIASQDQMVPIEELLNRAARITADLTPRSVERFPAISTTNLMSAEFHTEYLIEGFLAELEFGVLIGPKKSLKTSLSLLMSVCLATGAPLFGTFAVPKSKRVGFMSGESGPATIRSCLSRICGSMEIKPESVDNLVLCFSIPILASDTDVAEVERFIHKNRLEVLFIDCFYLMLGPNGGHAPNLFMMGGMLGKLLAIQLKTRCTVVLVHHTPKNMVCKVPELDDAAFAGVAEAARQWVLLNRLIPYDARIPGFHDLAIVAGGSAGHSMDLRVKVEEGSQTDPDGRRWSTTMASRGSADQINPGQHERRRQCRLKSKEESLAADRKAVVSTLTELDRVDTKTGIREATELPSGRFGAAWDSLLADQSISLFGTIKKGNNQPQDGYCLTSRVEEFRNRGVPDSSGQ